MTNLPDLPDHVRSAVVREPRTRSVHSRQDASPFQPYDSRYQYKLPKLQWFLLYAPICFVAFLLTGASGEDRYWAYPLLVVIALPVIFRGTQEFSRRAHRGWELDEEIDTYRWFDDSGEWTYSRYQYYWVPRLLRIGVALLMPALLWSVTRIPDKYDNGVTFFGVLVAFVAIMYVHRHLPTPFRRAERYRQCRSCGKTRSESSVRICPKCGRVAEVESFAALPSLTRRLRDL